MRTARSRTSGEYLFVVLLMMLHPTQELEPSANPVRFNAILSMAAKHGFNSARWMTYKQAKEFGGTVRIDSKASRSVYYGTFEKEVDGCEGEKTQQHKAV